MAENGRFVPEGCLTFRPSNGEIRASSYRDLIASGVSVHPDVVERTWGLEARNAYKKAEVAKISRELARK